jgi:hypothetical protein
MDPKDTNWTVEDDRQLAACRQELEGLKKDAALMKLAFKDYQKGELSEIAVLTILGGIINPSTITETDIEWANQALAAYDAAKEKKDG